MSTNSNNGGRRSAGGSGRGTAGRASGRSAGHAANRGGEGAGKKTRSAYPKGGFVKGTGGPKKKPLKRITQPQVKQSVPTRDVHDANGVRLQKVLAGAGIGSRRKCEEMILQGRVEVDDQIITELGIRIDPTKQKVRVDGEYVNLDTSRAYYALNKPLGVVSSMNDEHGRPDISYMLFNRRERLFHVGRLDADTDGLLLLTNDGDLAHRLQHPSYEISKTYVATIPGPIPKDLGRTLREGIELEDGVVKVDSFKLIDSTPGWAVVEIVLHEGKKHIVRRLLEAVGHPVQTLTRTAVGPIRLGQQKTGRVRELNAKEIAQLYAAAEL